MQGSITAQTDRQPSHLYWRQPFLLLQSFEAVLPLWSQSNSHHGYVLLPPPWGYPPPSNKNGCRNVIISLIIMTAVMSSQKLKWEIGHTASWEESECHHSEFSVHRNTISLCVIEIDTALEDQGWRHIKKITISHSPSFGPLPPIKFDVRQVLMRRRVQQDYDGITRP